MAKTPDQIPELGRRRRWKFNGQIQQAQAANEPMKGVYSDQPKASADKIANKPLIPKQEGSLGEGVPKMVPHKPGRFDGVGGIPHRMSKPALGASTYGHTVTQRLGASRVSGHPSAHHIGKKKI